MKQSLTRGWLAIVRDIMGASGNKTYKHSCLIAQQERFLFFPSQNINSCSSFIDCFLNSRWFCVCLPSGSRFCRRIYFAPPWEECWYRAKMFASSLAHFLRKKKHHENLKIYNSRRCEKIRPPPGHFGPTSHVLQLTCFWKSSQAGTLSMRDP